MSLKSADFALAISLALALMQTLITFHLDFCFTVSHWFIYYYHVYLPDRVIFFKCWCDHVYLINSTECPFTAKGKRINFSMWLLGPSWPGLWLPLKYHLSPLSSCSSHLQMCRFSWCHYSSKPLYLCSDYLFGSSHTYFPSVGKGQGFPDSLS